MTCKHKPGDTCGPECEPSAGLRESVVSHAELYLILRELGLEHKRPCDWSMEKVLALEASLNDRIFAAIRSRKG